MKLKDIFKSKNVLVIGDLMMDQYYRGQVKRISPEAPVPVFLKKAEDHVAGGAANVALNLVCANQNVYMASVIGNDNYASKIISILESEGCDCANVIRSESRKTSVKTRLLAQNNQQLVRIDDEITTPISKSEECQLLDSINSMIDKIDIVLLSDYMKGILTPDLCKAVIENCKKKNIPVLIDIKDTNTVKYCGATLLKPNRNELALTTGMKVETNDDIIKATAVLREKCQVEYVLVTLGSKGMFLMGEDLELWIPSFAQEVYDVCGAGDTVISYLCASMANGIAIADAAKISNQAAGIKVTKVGTAPVSLEEIDQKYNTYSDEKSIYQKTKKVVTLEELLTVLQNTNKKIVFTNGCFDILHFGHVGYLREAATLGDLLVVGLNSDASVKRLKGNDRPINCEYDRAEILSALEFVDYVVIFGEDTPYELIREIKPDVLVKGADYKKENVVGADIVEAKGGKVVLIPFLENHSTSSIIKKSNKI